MTSRTEDPHLLNLVFGLGEGATPEARAQTSTHRFVRGLDLLTLEESPKARGRRLTAREALEAYGFDKLVEAATDGSAILCESTEAAGRALRERREQLGLTERQVASQTHLTPELIVGLEEGRRRPVREYEKVARAIGLDERMLSYRTGADGNRSVAVRLRDLRDEKTALTPSVVAALAEAAWVAMTQIRIESGLQLPVEGNMFGEDPFYGRAGHPAYKVGYDLADAFRTKLGLGGNPIPSMRALVEQKLHIPVIQADLGRCVAGATVEINGRRAIVVNLSGRNQNVFIRRSTVAHELCHLLFDPRDRLRDLRVDEYDDLERREDQITDPVEQRANAFSVQVLAPRLTALRLYRDATSSDPLGQVLDHFGISFTAARYQIWNAMQRGAPLESINTDSRAPAPEWEGREAYTTTYHPIRELADHPERAGRFSALVVRAADTGIISWDTAGEWLLAGEEEVRRSAPAIRELYPDLF